MLQVTILLKVLELDIMGLNIPALIMINIKKVFLILRLIIIILLNKKGGEGLLTMPTP